MVATRADTTIDPEERAQISARLWRNSTNKRQFRQAQPPLPQRTRVNPAGPGFAGRRL